MANGIIKQKTYHHIHNTASLTSGTPFVVPADGYIRFQNSGVLYMRNQNGEYGVGMAVNRPATGGQVWTPVFVKKGMAVKWINDSGNSATCDFFMLE